MTLVKQHKNPSPVQFTNISLQSYVPFCTHKKIVNLYFPI